MPYLHWDWAHQLQRRNDCIQVAQSRKAVTRPSLDILSQYSDNCADEIGKLVDEVKNSQADFPETVMTRHELEITRYRRFYNVNELVLMAYLNVKSPIHPRRTLDHSRYPTLCGDDINIRDSDQVVYRHTKGLGLKPRLMMVDQLWLWIIDESESWRL
jgi:hypothetical protein